MPKLKRLSGQNIIRLLGESGFKVLSQSGSHVKLRRISEDGNKQTLVIPNHKSLDTGTIKAIVRQAKNYLTDKELLEIFYSD